jgi:hypothetical protein
MGTPNKPTGTIGVIKITAGPGKAQLEFDKVPFPKKKDEIEALIVNGFLKSMANGSSAWQNGMQASQNPEDDFDFILNFPNGVNNLLKSPRSAAPITRLLRLTFTMILRVAFSSRSLPSLLITGIPLNLAESCFCTSLIGTLL